MHIERAQRMDAPALQALLRRSGLPQDGIEDHVTTAFVACAGAALVGCAALDVYGMYALLGSVAVDVPAGGQG